MLPAQNSNRINPIIYCGLHNRRNETADERRNIVEINRFNIDLSENIFLRFVITKREIRLRPTRKFNAIAENKCASVKSERRGNFAVFKSDTGRYAAAFGFKRDFAVAPAVVLENKTGKLRFRGWIKIISPVALS